MDHLEVAENITSDTFLLATETWGIKGVPENPTAWLYVVAKNKTKDYFRRQNNFTTNILSDLKHDLKNTEEPELNLSEENISDSQLQMIFAVCNPLISAESQICLALRILCGFGIEEIAEAFLSTKETINKRLSRAKEKLRVEQVKIELPNDVEINNRLETVLATIYLLFNEGYYSSTQYKPVHKELCLEAMRLNYLLLENEYTNTPEANALMSLMCFHASRFEARMNDAGESILYEEQNRDLWNEDLIERGNYFLIQSAKGLVISKYHLEASIAYWHSSKIENSHKWENILQLYNKLLQIDYSPIVALNRTYALSKANGKEAAIVEAEKLQLTSNHLYYVLLGNLYAEMDNTISNSHYRKALSLAKTKSDKAIIEKYINSNQEKGDRDQ